MVHREVGGLFGGCGWEGGGGAEGGQKEGQQWQRSKLDFPSLFKAAAEKSVGRKAGRQSSLTLHHGLSEKIQEGNESVTMICTLH